MRFLVLFCACAPAAQSAKASEYFAWAPGSTWVYEAKFLAGKVETKTIVLGPKSGGFFVDDAGGKWAYDGEGLRDEKRYLLREPISVGKRWQSISGVGAAEDYEITRAHEACESRAGKFADCIEVRSTMPATDQRFLENTMTFAKGVGLVRVATNLKRGLEREPQVQVELVQFRAMK